MADIPYPDVPLSQFGDPTHRKYPCDTPEHCRAALRFIEMPKNQTAYSPDELAQVIARIHRLAKTHGVETTATDESTSVYLSLLHTAQQMENDSIATYLNALAVAPPDDIPDLLEITTDENDHSCIIRKIVERLEG